ncbi:MAG: TolC family protein [Bacteroidales bacterium]|jgi:cobalt-zinc-cadmium efflux system outer membrane protein|nr:TolC family protein [Bacteroidales bacterium]
MKKISRLLILFSLLLVSAANITYSQQEINFKSNPVTLSQFLLSVKKGNLGYIAGQFNVSIAEAEFKASKVFPDPEVSVAYSNNEDRTLQMGQSVETGISYSINTGNKRGAGISLARSQHELSQVILDAYFQNLRADASLSYFASLKNQKIYLLQENIYEQMSRLASTDSIRLKNGEATGIDALQSSLEARSQQTEVYQSLADMQSNLIDLMFLQGKRFSDTLDYPADNFPYKQRDLNLSELINKAVQNRADLLVAIKNKEVSEKNLNLLKANRAFEFSLETGYSYNSIVKNEIAPAPAFNGLSAGISFPIKFSNLNRGSLQAADLAVKQSQTIYEETELQITSEVLQAYCNFIVQNKKVEHYNLGLVGDADKILQGRIYSYQHGESSLVDVLNAQRTYIGLQLNYIEALFEYTAALIELERAAGIWDLTQ